MSLTMPAAQRLDAQLIVNVPIDETMAGWTASTLPVDWMQIDARRAVKDVTARRACGAQW